MSDYPREWDEILEEAGRDDRVGDHVGVVTNVASGQWPSGDAYTDVDLMLETAGNAKVNIRFNAALPSKAEFDTKKATMERSTITGLANAIRLRKALAQHFDITNPLELKIGTRMGVKVAKTKSGFPRVISIGPVPDTSKTAQGEDIPF